MVVAALIVAGLAALLHVYIFAMESLWWTSPRVRAVFGTTMEEADATRGFAFNQGFYNLFLAIVAGVGITAHAQGSEEVGIALEIAGVGSMLAAATVLMMSDPTKASAAIKQGVLPLVALVLLALRSLV